MTDRNEKAASGEKAAKHGKDNMRNEDANRHSAKSQPELSPKQKILDYFGSDFTPFYAKYGITGRQNGAEVKCRCPNPDHKDVHPSFSFNRVTGLFYCQGCNVGGDIFRFVHLFHGADDFPEQCKMIARDFGIDTLKERHGSMEPSSVTVYTYYRADGSVCSRKTVKRFSDGSKTAFWEHLSDGQWVKGQGEKLLYNLPSLAEADEILIVEGEKDCETAKGLRFTPTSLPDGSASRWVDSYAPHFRDKRVVVIPDNDEPGKAYVQRIAKALHGRVASLKVVELPDVPPKGDLTDFIEGLSDADERLSLIFEGTREWSPESPEVTEAPTGATDRGLPLTILRDLFAEPEENVTWVVDGLLQASGFSIVGAKPKTGKSTLTRCLAYAVATGQEFLGRQTSQGAVVYIALEDRRREVRRHFEDMGCTGAEPIHVYAARAPEDALKRLKTSIEVIRPSLVIIDPLFRFARVRDSSAYAEVTNKLEPILALARESCAHVCVTHHASKGEREGGDVLLGSTAIFGSVDTAIIQKRYDRYRTVKSIQRYGDDMDETVLGFDPATRMLSLGESRAAEDVRTAADKIVELLRVRGGSMTEPEINAEVEGKTTTMRKAIRELFTSGRIERTGSGRRGDPFRYSHPGNSPDDGSQEVVDIGGSNVIDFPHGDDR